MFYTLDADLDENTIDFLKIGVNNDLPLYCSNAQNINFLFENKIHKNEKLTFLGFARPAHKQKCSSQHRLHT